MTAGTSTLYIIITTVGTRVPDAKDPENKTKR